MNKSKCHFLLQRKQKTIVYVLVIIYICNIIAFRTYMKSIVKNIDIWGSTTSIACAVHCAAMPILLSTGVLSSHSWIANPLFEFTILALTTLFIYHSIIKGYFTGKSSRLVFITACIGLFLILTHHLFSQAGTIAITFGGILVAAAHMINIKQHSHSVKA